MKYHTAVSNGLYKREHFQPVSGKQMNYKPTPQLIISGLKVLGGHVMA